MVSKIIKQTPGVRDCFWGEFLGFDYKYSVELHKGWIFSKGRNAGCDWCNFNSVKEFLANKPVRKGKDEK